MSDKINDKINKPNDNKKKVKKQNDNKIKNDNDIKQFIVYFD